MVYVPYVMVCVLCSRRLVFPNFTYDIDEQGNRRRPIIVKQTAMIFTMNIPEEAMEEWKYPILLGTCENSCGKTSAIAKHSTSATPISSPTTRGMPSPTSARRTNESIATNISPPTCRMPMSWANDWLANARKDSKLISQKLICYHF